LSRFDTAAISTAESQSTVQRYGGHELPVTDARQAHPLAHCDLLAARSRAVALDARGLFCGDAGRPVEMPVYAGRRVGVNAARARPSGQKGVLVLSGKIGNAARAGFWGVRVAGRSGESPTG
jgi:hypothetical protein